MDSITIDSSTKDAMNQAKVFRHGFNPITLITYKINCLIDFNHLRTIR